jgi:hypothetical protein
MLCRMELPHGCVSQVLSTAWTRKHSLFFVKTCLAPSSSVYHSGPMVGVTRKILATGTKFNQTSRVGLLEVLSRVPTVVTTEVDEDVDGGGPRDATGSTGSSHH